MVNLIKPTKNAHIIRVSELATFNECKRKWDYQYKKSLVKVNAKVGARELGTLFHEVMRVYYTALKDKKPNEVAQADAWVAFAMESQKLLGEVEQDQIDLFQGMIEGYFAKYAAIAETWEILYVEHRFYAKIPSTNAFLTGQFDIVARVPNYGVVILDFKTWKDLAEFADVQHNIPPSAYLWIAAQNGLIVREFMYDMVKKQLPSPPRILADGTLSLDKDQRCYKHEYARALAEMLDNPMLTPKQQQKLQDMKPKYEAFLAAYKEPTFFSREVVARTARYLQSFEKNLVEQAKIMTSKKTFIGYNNSKQCKYCDYVDLCDEVNNQGDWRSKLKYDYKIAVLGNAPV